VITARLDIFAQRLDNAFNITGELAGLVAMKGTIASKDLHDEIKTSATKVEYSNSEINWNCNGWGTPSVAGEDSGLSTLITRDVQNATGNDLFACHCLIRQENVCVIRADDIMLQLWRN
jgi:hypothetical protein